MPLLNGHRVFVYWVDREIYDAAKARTEAHAQSLSAIARAILFKAGEDIQSEPLVKGTSEVSGRISGLRRDSRDGVRRAKLAFAANSNQVAHARKALRSRGVSMTRVFNEGLLEFALTGKIFDVREIFGD